MFNILKNGAQVGTITFGSNGTTGAFAVATDVNFFPGDVLNDQDLILNAIPDKAARARMICNYLPHTTSNSAEGDVALRFAHDLVLRGRFETPFETN